jgi:hypothetical protein
LQGQPASGQRSKFTFSQRTDGNPAPVLWLHSHFENFIYQFLDPGLPGFASARPVQKMTNMKKIIITTIIIAIAIIIDGQIFFTS